MVTASTAVAASIEDVFAALTDPDTYPDWLRGCADIRDIDDRWPEPGSAFHHRVGFGPVKIDDRTEVVAIDAPARLELLARAGPVGDAQVIFELATTPRGCEVTIRERPVHGTGRLLWVLGGRPVMKLQLLARNKDSLRLLRDLVERTAATT